MIKTIRTAHFRRLPNGALRLVNNSRTEEGFVFRESRGWHDGETKFELWVDGEFMQRWDADEWGNDPWSIGIFARLWAEGFRSRIRRPLPRG